MALQDIRKAFEKAVLAMPDSLGNNNTAFEAVEFTPKTNVPYQRLELKPFDPENPTLGDGYYREVGFFQVVLCYPKGKGVGAITQQAEKMQTYFKRGTTLIENNQEINVQRTPTIAPFYINGDRLEVVIRIRYYCEQNKNDN